MGQFLFLQQQWLFSFTPLSIRNNTKICQNMPPTHTKFVHMPIFCGRGAKAISCWYQATTWYPSLIKISIYDVDFLLFSKNFAQFCQDIFSSCYSTRHIIFLPLYDNFWFLLTKIVRAWNTFSTAIFPPILHIHSVEQMTIAVSNFSFIMSLMTFFLTMKVEALQNPIINLEKEGRDKNLSAGYGVLVVHLFHRKYWP